MAFASTAGAATATGAITEYSGAQKSTGQERGLLQGQVQPVPEMRQVQEWRWEQLLGRETGWVPQRAPQRVRTAEAGVGAETAAGAGAGAAVAAGADAFGGADVAPLSALGLAAGLAAAAFCPASPPAASLAGEATCDVPVVRSISKAHGADAELSMHACTAAT